MSHESFKDQDPTPRATNDQWRFTPSLLDPNSFSFANFANQPPGYYTPTPGGTNTIYHPQAGDLHTPTLGLGMGIGLNTPLSLSTSETSMQPPPGTMPDVHNLHGLAPHQFHFNPFVQASVSQPSFAPTTFVHQDTGYETIEKGGSPMDSDVVGEQLTAIDATVQPGATFHRQTHFVPTNIAANLPSAAEKFRFHSTLNAPTAMVKHNDEIPVTYLNKGQAYSLSIVDTASAGPIVPGTRYRTFVRISFEDDQQRQKPSVCWSLWKEGRGTNEAHQRGGKLQAVEFVEAGQPAEGDDKRTRIELESASFDGFSVLWTPGVNGMAECNIAVRFNFLSTDFSHSKGVKGIPVRLCAKTSPMPLNSTTPPAQDGPSEICYCKVKLFRDHGAERKLSNDVAHVKKTIDKLKQQIAQAESGMKDFGKRKRGTKGSTEGQRPGKLPKHKRTWSVSSASSAGGGRMPSEDDLHMKLQSLQDMFTSTRPVSVLYLRGEDLDDPDAHPVTLPGEPLDLTKIDRENPVWQARSNRSSIAESSMVSPSPSSLSLHSQVSVAGQTWDESSRQSSAEQPSKVEQHDEAGNLSGWIEALGVDPSYKPPVDRNPKPVACFYVIQKQDSDSTKQGYHRAIYLMQRSVKELISRIALKWQLEPSSVIRILRVLPSGLGVEIDDEVVQSIPEGQDMILDISETSTAPSDTNHDWDMVDVEPGNSVPNGVSSLDCELRLSF